MLRRALPLCLGLLLLGCSPDPRGGLVEVEDPEADDDDLAPPQLETVLEFESGRAPRVFIHVLLDTARGRDLDEVTAPFMSGLAAEGVDPNAWATAAWTGASMLAYAGTPTFASSNTPIYGLVEIDREDWTLEVQIGPDSDVFNAGDWSQAFVSDALRERAGPDGRVLDLVFNTNPIFHSHFSSFHEQHEDYDFESFRRLSVIAEAITAAFDDFGELGEDDVVRVFVQDMTMHMPLFYEDDDLEVVCDVSALPPWPVDDGDVRELRQGGDQGLQLSEIVPTLTGPEIEALNQWLRCGHRAAMHHADGVLAGLQEDLAQRGWGDDVLWQISSDHGEQYGERGQIGHGQSAHPEETRALWITWASGLVPASVGSGVVSTQDLLPTLIAAGVYPLPDAYGGFARQLEGVPLGFADDDRVHHVYASLAAQYGPPLGGGDSLTVIGDGAQVSSVTDDWLVVLSLDGGLFVYDLRTDPHATDNLFDPDAGLDAMGTDAAGALDRLLPLTEEAFDEAAARIATDPWSEVELEPRLPIVGAR